MRILGVGMLVAATACVVLSSAATADTVTEPVLPTLAAVDNPNVCLLDAGSRGWCGDGDLAGKARLAGPRDVAPLAGGGYLIADTLNHVVRRVDARGIITTVAGIAARGSSGDGAPAAQARLDAPSGVAALAEGFVVADAAARVVRRVDRDGVIHAFAGSGAAGAAGDGGPALKATLKDPRAVAALADGSVLIADAAAHRVRRVSPNGVISAFAGSGVEGTSGDGGRATAAALVEPTYVAPEPGGSVLIADRGAARIRRVTADGTISTVAGGETGGGTAATALRLGYPSAVTSTLDGGFLISEAAIVRQVRPDGTAGVVAGTGVEGFNDALVNTHAGLASAARLKLPTAVAWTGDGEALIADASNDRIRRLNLSGGIRTIAGFDRPDQVLGIPPVSTNAGLRTASASGGGGGGSCSSRSKPGVFNVLRLQPYDLPPSRPGKSVTLYIESSASAKVKLTVKAPRSRRATSQQFEVKPNAPKPVPLRKLRKGKYTIRIDGTIKSPKTKRCDNRVLPVR